MGNRFIASLRSALSRFGRGGDRSIASLRSALSRFGRGGDRFIASLCSALSRFGVGVGESLHCFTPFRFITIWGWGRGIASLLHSVPLHRDLGLGLGNRFIASLHSASSRFGDGEGESLHCFTPFRFIAIWGWGWGIASLLHSVPLYRDLRLGLGNRFIASLRSALSRFGRGGESLHCFTPFRFIAIWGRGRGIAEAISRKPSTIIPPYGSSDGISNWNHQIAKRNFPS